MKAQNAQAYINLFENLSPKTIEAMGDFVCPDVHFKDPFNDVIGIGPLRRILHKTLEDVANPVFIVTIP